MYNRLREDKLSGSKHVEDIKIKDENMNLENVHFVCLCCMMWLKSCKFIMINHNCISYYAVLIFTGEIRTVCWRSEQTIYCCAY